MSGIGQELNKMAGGIGAKLGLEGSILQGGKRRKSGRKASKKSRKSKRKSRKSRRKSSRRRRR